MVIALMLRLAGIGRESLWWDEYTSHVYLDAPSLFDFLVLNRTLDPLTLPFYYTLEYLWTHYVHDSVFALRLMSILIGVGNIPILYVLGKRLYGVRAGLLAAALLTVSPTHIHHSQSIRMYVVFIFLATVVMWSFVQLLEKPHWRLWALHAATSFLLYWTHPFAGLVPAVLGSFLLLHFFFRRAMFLRWTLLQFLLYAPTVVYLSSVRFWPKNTTTDWIAPPSLPTLAADLFFDDITAFHWQFRLSDFAVRLGGFRLGLDVLFAGVILVLLSFLAWRQFQQWRGGVAQNSSFSLLFFWVFLPPLMLFVVSWVLRPCMFPRYTVHCVLAVYLLLAGAVQLFQSRGIRALASGVLVGLLLLQWVWLQPGPQRTDWRSAGLLLHEQAKENDVVLVESLLWRDVFTHNLKHMTPGPLLIPVAAAEKAPLLAAQAALCLGMLPRFTESGSASRVWAVVALDYFDPGPPVQFEECLKRWGIPFDRWFYPAIREVYVYRMKPPETPPPDTMEALFANWDRVYPGAGRAEGDLDHHAMQAFGDLATELAFKGRSQMALEILDGIFNESAFAKQIYGNLHEAIASGTGIEDKAKAIKQLWDGYGFRDNGQPEYMRRAFEKAVALDPRHAIANFELGLELAAANDCSGAREALLRVVEIDPTYRDMLKSLLDALALGEDVPAKLDAVVAYRKALMAIAANDSRAAEELLGQALKLDPTLSAAQLMLGYVLTKQDRFEGADAVLRQYLEISESPDVDAFANMALIHAENNRAAEAKATLEQLFEKSPSTRKVYGSLMRVIDAGGDVPAAAAAVRAFWSGFEARKQGRTDEARKAFRQAAALDPGNAFAQLEYGLELAAEGAYPEALAALKEAGKFETSYRDMLANLVVALEKGEGITGVLDAVLAFRKALVALSEDKGEEAEGLLQQAVELDPAFAAAQLMLGYVLTTRNQLARADEVLDNYLNMSDSPDVDAFAHMALIHAENNRPDEVASTLEKLFEKSPSAQKVYGPLIDAIHSGGDLQKAAAAIRAFWKGFELRNQDKRDEARQAFALAVQEDPKNAYANLELGLELAAAGDNANAAAALKRASELDASYHDMLVNLVGALDRNEEVGPRLEAVLAYRNSLFALGRKDTAQAEQYLQQALQLDPRLSEAQLMLGYVLTERDHYDKADAALAQYLAMSETPDVDAYAHMALIQAEHNRPDLVAETLARLFEKNPTARKVYGSLLEAVTSNSNVQQAAASIRALWAGFDARRKGKEEEALTAFAKAVETDSRNTLASLELGLGLAECGDRPGAAGALNRAAEQDPEYRNMLQHLLGDLESGAELKNDVTAVRAYRRGLLAQSQGDSEAAVQALEDAVQADPRMDDAHTSRVFNLVILRRFDEALAGIERYITGTRTPAAGAYGLLTVIHIARSQAQEALQAARKAMNMDADYAAQFGPLFLAILEERNYDKAKAEMDKLKAQGIDLYPLMHDLVVDYLKTPADAAPSESDKTAEKKASRYWDDVNKFVEEDKTSVPKPDEILFTGSSTARLWDVKKWFPELPVLNRGFGGSAFSDVALLAEEILGNHQPAIIVLYSGDNDIAHGKSAEQTAADCVAAVERLRALAPESRIIVLGTKPSGARWDKYPVMQQSNALIAERLAGKEKVKFLDLACLLLGNDGKPLKECYVEDQLHLSDEGYRRWSEAMRQAWAQ